MKTQPCGRILLIIIFAVAAVLWAGEPWKDKPWTEWTEKDVKKLLEKSPWAQRVILKRHVVDLTPVTVPLTGQQGFRSPRSVSVHYVVQLRSALPIRQAEVRLKQLKMKYDTMTKEERKAFDKAVVEFLNMPFSDEVVFRVFHEHRTSMDREMNRSYWGVQTTERLQDSVFIVGGLGEKVPLLHYEKAKDVSSFKGTTFYFVFPRRQDSRPLVSLRDKTLKLQFKHPDCGQVQDNYTQLRNEHNSRLQNDQAYAKNPTAWNTFRERIFECSESGESRVRVEFKVKDLMFNGGIAY